MYSSIYRPGSRRREVDLVDLEVSKSSQVVDIKSPCFSLQTAVALFFLSHDLH